MNKLEVNLYENLTGKKNISRRGIRKYTTGDERSSIKAFIAGLRQRAVDEVEEEFADQVDEPADGVLE